MKCPRCVSTLCAHAVCSCCVFMLCAHAVCPRCVPTLCARAVCSCCVLMLCAHAVCSRCVPMLCVQVVSTLAREKCSLAPVLSCDPGGQEVRDQACCSNTYRIKAIMLRWLQNLKRSFRNGTTESTKEASVFCTVTLHTLEQRVLAEDWWVQGKTCWCTRL